jgi:hypothetical protein
MHFVVHIRLYEFARHAVAVKRSDTRVIHDAAQTLRSASAARAS